MSAVRDLATPHGPARLVLDPAPDSGPAPRATLLVSHGAGAGVDTHDLLALAEALPPTGVSVVRLQQPWHVAGRRIATPPPTLDDALLAAVAAVADLGAPYDGPLVVGGRSAGARSAARCAGRAAAAGCLALSFPLHPPRRPERSRLPELLGAGVPTLVLQGERDAMGTPGEFGELADHGVELVVVPGADHSLAVTKRSGVGAGQVAATVVDRTLAWLGRTVAGNARGGTGVHPPCSPRTPLPGSPSGWGSAE